MYKRYFEIIKKLTKTDAYEEITLSKRNIDAMMDLKQQYVDMLGRAGDIAGLKILDSFTFDDILSLMHAGFSESALDESARNVVNQIDKMA